MAVDTNVAAALGRLTVCPRDRSTLAAEGSTLTCTSCGTAYEVTPDGIALLLPPTEGDGQQERYRSNYEQIATDDLTDAIVPQRGELLHSKLVRFIGDVRGQAVLDIGSANALYLSGLPARERIAVDIALPYLRNIDGSRVLRVCGDAESLPVDLSQVDTVVIADVLEHLLHPERLVSRLATDLRPGARVIVHVPWEETLEQYLNAPYEFVHLRSFNDVSLRSLFRDFDVVRERSSLPRLDRPLIYAAKGRVPRGAFNWLAYLYYQTPLKAIDDGLREHWQRNLPGGEAWLLKLFPATFKMFELVPARRRKRTDRVAGALTDAARRMAGGLAAPAA